MTVKAVFLGSIGAVSETSDIQRRAYNSAMKEAGVEWEWDRETYSELLESAGGRERLDMLSRATGAGLSDETMDTIHARKTEIACAEVRTLSNPLRAGVADLVAHARERGLKLGFVTTTYSPNVDAVLHAAGMSREDFDVVVTRDEVERGKPAPDAYELALERLDLKPDEVIAVEDTSNSVRAAKRAGIRTVATPGEFTQNQDTSDADLSMDCLGTSEGLDARVLELIG